MVVTTGQHKLGCVVPFFLDGNSFSWLVLRRLRRFFEPYTFARVTNQPSQEPVEHAHGQKHPHLRWG